MDRRWRGPLLFLCGLLAGAALVGGPAVARVIADYARNAERVDGFSAVGFGSEHRAGKVVATDDRGRLPDNIIRHAPDAARLGGRAARAYQLKCSTTGGYASVPANLGTDWRTIEGYGLTVITGGVPASRRVCAASEAKARRTGVGVVEVALIDDALCPPWPEQPAAAVSVSDARALIATVTPGGCDEELGPIYVIRTFDAEGVPTDAPATILLHEPAELLLP